MKDEVFLLIRGYLGRLGSVASPKNGSVIILKSHLPSHFKVAVSDVAPRRPAALLHVCRYECSTRSETL